MPAVFHSGPWWVPMAILAGVAVLVIVALRRR
jgi:hypothetical protein